jgi:hypothetical protein
MNDSQIQYIKLESPEGISETISAEQTGDNTYLVLENPVFNCKINYGTVVRAMSDEKGELVMTGIAKLSDYKTRKFLLSTYAKDSDFVKRIGDPIIAAGGKWEVVMGGVVFIHILKASSFDLDAFFTEKGFHPTEITGE